MRSARKESGMTQTDLANRLSMRHASISEYERGVTMAQPETLLAIAQQCGVTVDWLLTGKEAAASQAEHPAFKSFLHSEIGKTLTESEIETLRSITIVDGEPVDGFYQLVLTALRGGLVRR